MTFKKTKLMVGIAAATFIGAALVSPQAFAHKASKKHKHRAATTSYSAASYGDTRVNALEQQVAAMQSELSALRSQQATAASAESAKVAELDQWMATVKAAPVVEKTKDNMMFFRGGYSHNNTVRGGTLDPTDVPALGLRSNNGVLAGPITDKDGWYFGAGFDFSLNNNLFGLMDNTEVLAELMVEYKELGTRGNNGLSPLATTNLRAATGLNLPAANTRTATVNQLSITASPKIKFLKGSNFRPWIIPVGFELDVISPPSDAITVLNPGMQFGLGADYKLWKDIYVGADARYHYAPSKVDGVETNGVTAGGYIGLGF